MADRTYRSPGNPNNCGDCGHLPVAHEVDGRGGRLGPCWGRPASERPWWRHRACDCAGYVPRVESVDPEIGPWIREQRSQAIAELNEREAELVAFGARPAPERMRDAIRAQVAVHAALAAVREWEAYASTARPTITPAGL